MKIIEKFDTFKKLQKFLKKFLSFILPTKAIKKGRRSLKLKLLLFFCSAENGQQFEKSISLLNYRIEHFKIYTQKANHNDFIVVDQLLLLFEASIVIILHLEEEMIRI